MMKNTKVNLIHFLSALCFSSLLLTVSALTDSYDAEAIGLLLETFPELRPIFARDPCLPKPYPWLECSSDFTPRVIALRLSNRGLISSSLPDFSAMDALEIIDLSENFLIQEFPDFLANFRKLRVLNLTSTHFFGTVPTILKKKSDEQTLTLTVKGMEKWCFSDQKTCGTQTRTSPGLTTGLTPTPRSTESSKGTLSLGVRIVIRIAIGIGILIVLFVICLAIILIIGHCPNKKAAAASGPIDEISGLAMPVNTETEQQMHPTLQRVQA